MLKRGGNDDVVVLTLRLEAPEASTRDGNGEAAQRWTFNLSICRETIVKLSPCEGIDARRAIEQAEKVSRWAAYAP